MVISVQEFNFDELRRATDDFSPSRLIGKGSHGCVYKGQLQSGPVFAVKTPSPGLQNLQDNTKLLNEITVLSSLPALHPNIVNLLGRATVNDAEKDSPLVIMVMEFMPNGSLHDLLHSNGGIVTDWRKRLQIATQIARGVKFLHGGTPALIHRDVKSANVLFDSEWNAKLADFGLAVTSDDDKSRDSVSQPAGTMGYLDPSYTEPCKLSTKNDVFSFGVVLLEILCCRKAIDLSRSPASIADWALKLMANHETKLEKFVSQNRVALPSYMKSAVRGLLKVATRCVSPEEHHRPSMDEVLLELENTSVVVERVRFPTWISVLRVIVVLRKEKGKIAVKRSTVSPSVTASDIIDTADQVIRPKRRLLRELLEDVTVT